MTRRHVAGVVAVVAALLAAGVVLTFVDATPERDAAPGPAPSMAGPPTMIAGAAAVAAQASAGSAASAVLPPAAAAATASAASGPRIAPVIDWGRYPGSLHTQIQHALQAGDGVMAADLARKLWECSITARLMTPDAIQRQAAAGGDAALAAARNAQLQDYQRILARCQTVVGDPAQLRRALLDVGVAQGVVGTSYESHQLGGKSPEVLHGLVRDALAGHVASLVTATSSKPAELGLSTDQQRMLRHAFELAANDPDVGRMIRPYVDMAETHAFHMAGESSRHFNHDGLTEAMRAQARLLAAQVVRRIKEPRPDEVIGPEVPPAR
ncbi:MAG: hypothetical protein GXC94_02390 [Comamonadaceae bacterium]|jgi:hypothetical protein|nr:hypothetical protein [Comamonadaceae bacterium]